MNYYIRPSKKTDCYELSLKLRKGDVQEVFSSSGSNPIQALMNAYIASHKHCYSVILDQEVVGMFGVNKINNTIGIPWLMGSDYLTKYSKEFHELSIMYISTFMDEFELLYNYVDQRNQNAIKWLKSLGFVFLRLIQDFGYEKKPFYEFIKTKDV